MNSLRSSAINMAMSSQYALPTFLRIFHGLIDFLVFRMDVMNTSQLSNIVELGLVLLPKCSSFGFVFLDIPAIVEGACFGRRVHLLSFFLVS